jgi:5-methylcytosine-specific restriction endonuclease McrA
VCGEKYEKIQYYAERSRFCSEKCQGSWTSENRTGENSPNWKGGYNPYYGPNWREQRRKVWERDDETCQACGQTTDELGQRPSVHHIIPFRECDDYEEANKLSNLVCLCRSCHGEWEGIPLRPNTAPVDD